MFQRWDYRPGIVLVFDKNHKIVGSLRHFDVLRGLEPKYPNRSLRRSGKIVNLQIDSTAEVRP